jgi:MSHA biogenesis protein MshM
MYLKHFAIEKHPFKLTPDTEFLCNYSSHQEALNTLLFSINSGEGIVKVIGEVGLGKTFLCRELLNALDDNKFIVVYIPNPDLEEMELKQTILRELQSKISLPLAADVNRDITKIIFDHIFYCQQNGKNVIVIIDEAQALSDANLEILRLLTNLETEAKKLLQIVLFGQPELKQRLLQHSLRQFNQRVTFSYDLKSLDYDETIKYLADRLVTAGHNNGNIFTKAAREVIYTSSKGAPRIINILAHKAMLAAYGKGKQKIDFWAARLAVIDSKELVISRNYLRTMYLVLILLSVSVVSMTTCLILLKYGA